MSSSVDHDNPAFLRRRASELRTMGTTVTDFHNAELLRWVATRYDVEAEALEYEEMFDFASRPVP
jgi:hypothetical protein